MKNAEETVQSTEERRKIGLMSVKTKEQLRASTKVCSRCKTEKPGTEYTIFRTTKGTLALMGRCKTCRAAIEADKRTKGIDHVSKNPDYQFPTYHPGPEKVREASKAYFDKHQRESLEGATNNYKEWTGPELEILARRELAAREIAVMLNRTIHSVRRMRVKMGSDPRKRDLAGLPVPSEVTK